MQKLAEKFLSSFTLLALAVNTLLVCDRTCERGVWPPKLTVKSKIKWSELSVPPDLYMFLAVVSCMQGATSIQLIVPGF